MNSVLVLFAHPALESSRINRHLRAAALDVAGVTFHDLYEEYPDFDVDVAREQRLMEEHEVVVLQHPFYWYSTPALVKQWFDLVLEHGWAYGTGGTALRGKKLLSAISTGAGAEAYQPDGFHAITLTELLAPIRQTARLCGMQYLEPFFVNGAFRVSDAEVRDEARRYRQRLEELCREGTP